jgi:hypothetical protein
MELDFLDGILLGILHRAGHSVELDFLDGILLGILHRAGHSVEDHFIGSCQDDRIQQITLVSAKRDTQRTQFLYHSLKGTFLLGSHCTFLLVL